jgi:hypothetical protein
MGFNFGLFFFGLFDLTYLRNRVGQNVNVVSDVSTLFTVSRDGFIALELLLNLMR